MQAHCQYLRKKSAIEEGSKNEFEIVQIVIVNTIDLLIFKIPDSSTLIEKRYLLSLLDVVHSCVVLRPHVAYSSRFGLSTRKRKNKGNMIAPGLENTHCLVI